MSGRESRSCQHFLHHFPADETAAKKLSYKLVGAALNGLKDSREVVLKDTLGHSPTLTA